jgi:hypothetical protein
MILLFLLDQHILMSRLLQKKGEKLVHQAPATGIA